MQNVDIEAALDELPDKVADALFRFKEASLERERIYSKSFLEIKARSAGEKVTVAEMDATIKSDDHYHQACLDEITAEAEWTRVNEKLMAAKKQAAMRTAF